VLNAARRALIGFVLQTDKTSSSAINLLPRLRFRKLRALLVFATLLSMVEILRDVDPAQASTEEIRGGRQWLRFANDMAKSINWVRGTRFRKIHSIRVSSQIHVMVVLTNKPKDENFQA
jgi:hypothetical protein